MEVSRVFKNGKEKYSIVMVEWLDCDIFPFKYTLSRPTGYNCSVLSSPYQSQEFNFFNFPCS